MWGIDDGNNIVEYNPELERSGVVIQTGLTAPASSNGMAFDAVHRDIFFGHGGTASSDAKGIYVWRQGAPSIKKIATLRELQLSHEPTNAFFYDGYYWFVLDEMAILKRCRILYDPDSSTADIMGLGAPEEFLLEIPPGMTGQQLTVADIALHTPTKSMYGVFTTAGGLTHPSFFRVDLNVLEANSRLPLAIISENIGQSLQLSFDTSFENLYGVRDGAFCIIDRLTGNRTVLSLGTSGSLVRDLAGASSASASSNL